MRIDNPKPDQLLPGDTGHFKPQKVRTPAGGYFVAESDYEYGVSDIDYITREDTLGVGDEFTLANDTIVRCVVAVKNGYAFYTVEDQASCGPIDNLFRSSDFKILRKHNDPR